MPTKLLYFSKAYQQTATAKVIQVLRDGPQTGIILDQTLFYPQGGGQPADQGSIIAELGNLAVSHVSYNGGEVLHKGKLVGEVKEGETVTLEVFWPLRYQHMQQHTAGHIVDQAVKNVLPESKSIDGNHGISKKMYIEFSTEVSAVAVSKIQTAVNEIVESAVPITSEMVSYEELVRRQIKLPFDLPKNKELRIVQIGKYPAMPDGGTQLSGTGESWPITIVGVDLKESSWRVIYSLTAPGKTAQLEVPEPEKTKEKAEKATLSLSKLRERIADLKAQLSFEQTTGEERKTKYLGKKGYFNELAQVMKNLEAADRKEAGQLLNDVKTYLEKQLQRHLQEQAQNQVAAWVDLSIPGVKPVVGHMHPVSQAMEEITQIFERIGFTRVRYPEVDWDHYVFEALNMPPNHPARDEWETFFVEAPIDKKLGKVVLTTHTSNGQVHEMERLNSTPPIRMVNIGRCYRRQQDATHTQMFHQFEGLVVDKGINIQHLKGTLDYFAQEFYGPDTKSRIRPFHFQFTEPSFEVDFSCHICGGTGVLNPEGNHPAKAYWSKNSNEKQPEAETKCKFCKSGWHEVGGAGMVHPNVLKAGGIDPEVYTGFAFGWGIERTYTLKPGLNIDDIRLIYGGDLRFLEQF